MHPGSRPDSEGRWFEERSVRSVFDNGWESDTQRTQQELELKRPRWHWQPEAVATDIDAVNYVICPKGTGR